MRGSRDRDVSGGWGRALVQPALTECLLWAGSAMMKIQQEGAHSPPETRLHHTVTAQGAQGRDGKAPGSGGGSPEEAPNLVGEGESEAGEEGV